MEKKLSNNSVEIIDDVEVMSWNRQRSSEQLRAFVFGRLEAIGDLEDFQV